jgi:hypothetical protein
VATSPEAVRAQLAVATTAASAEVVNAVAGVALERQVQAALTATQLIVPAYYDAAGSLAVAWYDERRDESSPSTSYSPTIIGDPETDWIEREVEKFRDDMAADLEIETQRMLDEAVRLAEKEIARGFRQTITVNAVADPDAAGWKRHARPEACKFCLMLEGKGAVYVRETATFAAHTSCHCIAGPEFGGKEIWAEATPMQYAASSRRAPTEEAQAERNAKLRAYLNENYPDAPG